MIDKLMAMPIETLVDLQEKVRLAIDAKRRQDIRVNSIAAFDNKEGVPTKVFIQRINGKSVSGYEVAADGTHMPKKRWRIGLGLLRPLDHHPGTPRHAATGSW